MTQCGSQRRLEVHARGLSLAAVVTIVLSGCAQDLNIGSMLQRDASVAGGNGGSDSPPVTGSAGGGETGAGGATGGNAGSDASVGAIDARESDDSSDGSSSVDARADVRDGSPVADVVDAEVCRPPRTACSRGDDCCSDFCIGLTCFVPPTTCQASGSCTLSGNCCSGRCNPDVGGVSLVCSAFCAADGARCATPQDCCSLGCTNGLCGGLCRSQGVACSSNADCCSNNCDLATTGLCLFVGNDHDLCQFAGEQCLNTDEAVNCCNSTCNPTTGRCNLPATVCHGTGSVCVVDADCCKGRCLLNAQNQRVCEIPCAADGVACTSNAECCGFRCTGSPPRCAPPVAVEGGAVCLPTGRGCTSSAQCCSQSCVADSCDLPCQLRGVPCRVGTDCCSGICTGNVCQP